MGGGGRGGSEAGGGGVGRDSPPPRVPLWSPPKAGQKILSFNPLDAEQPQTLEGEERGVWGGGGTPPPTVYGRSSTPPPL